MALSQELKHRSLPTLVEPLAEERPAASSQLAESRFTYEAPTRKPYPEPIGCLRRNIFKIFVFVVFTGTIVYLTTDWFLRPETFVHDCKLFSVPLVCMVFTWFHVWLALQMVFYPIEFQGCGQRAIVPRCLGLPINGWQGIVPSRIDNMAKRAVDAMIGNIVTIDEFMERVQPDHFYNELQHVMDAITTNVMERIMVNRWPTVWEALPDSVKQEVKQEVLHETRQSFGSGMQELKDNINSIVDLKQMSVDALVNNPRMFVEMFTEIAPRELSFIQHVAAVLGFVLGLVQVAIYVSVTGDYIDFVLLPVSGLLIGYLTNWLALKMTFAPVWPHMYCGGYLNFQGVFLKRQREAAEKMSELICAKVVDARAILQYIVTSCPAGVDKLLEIYQRQLEKTIEKGVGQARNCVPSFVGERIDDIKQDVLQISLELLPAHTSEIERYMDETMKVQATLAYRLARLQPPQFEAIVHPIFQDDEWMLMVVGAFLGIVIGVLQAWALMAIPE